jgi:hypothetical protein
MTFRDEENNGGTTLLLKNVVQAHTRKREVK